MSSGGRWRVGLASAGLVLGLGGCDLAALADKLADDFERGIQERAAEAVRNAQAKIGQSGGDVTTHDGAVAIPAGAVEGEVQVAVAEVDPATLSAPLSSALDPVTPPVAFTPHGTQFSEAVTLSLFFDKTVGTSNLHVIRLDNEQDTSWERVDPETVQFDSGLALVSTTHFSVYGVVSCDSGKFADLCRAFESGEATVADLAEEAPPSDDAWGGVYQPPSGDDDGPGTMTDQCRDWLEQCRPVFDTCSKDPAADICSRVEECLSYAEKCGATLPPIGGGDDPCAPLAEACKAGDRVACDAYNQCVNPPDDQCMVLQHDCAYGNKDACTQFDSLCGSGPIGGDCEKLNSACAAGDDNACQLAAEQCGNMVLDCNDLALKCKAGDAVSCRNYDLNCGAEPPPPSCDQQRSDCFGLLNPDACYSFFSSCAFTADDCLNAQAGCDGANPDACYAAEPYCGPAGGTDCVTTHDACFGSGITDTQSCDAFFGNCRPSPEDCAALDSACVNSDQYACSAEKTYCPAPPPPPPDGGTCGEIVWEICKTVDNCGSAVTCEGDPPPVRTDVQPVAGDLVHCDYMQACTADGMFCSDNWACVVNP